MVRNRNSTEQSTFCGKGKAKVSKGSTKLFEPKVQDIAFNISLPNFDVIVHSESLTTIIIINHKRQCFGDGINLCEFPQLLENFFAVARFSTT